MTLYVEIETVPIEVPEGTDAESIKKLSLSACTARVYAIDDREAEAHQKTKPSRFTKLDDCGR